MYLFLKISDTNEVELRQVQHEVGSGPWFVMYEAQRLLQKGSFLLL